MPSVKVKRKNGKFFISGETDEENVVTETDMSAINTFLRGQEQFSPDRSHGPSMLAMSGVVYVKVEEELTRQQEIWGEQNHSTLEWLAIVLEEFGEAAKELVNDYFESQETLDAAQKEIIETIACLAQLYRACEQQKEAA